MTNIPTPPKSQPFLTIIEGRRPKQKAHVTFGHAKNALTCIKREGTLWELKNGVWVLKVSATVEYVPIEYASGRSWNKPIQTLVYQDSSEIGETE
mgnify:CR=1 FL=1